MSAEPEANAEALVDSEPAREEIRQDMPVAWVPRGYQSGLWKALRGGVKRADVVAHRRWGKDEVALHWAAASALVRPGIYWHMLPQAEQGKRAIWTAINPHTGRKRIDEAFAPHLRKATHESDMRIEMTNGAIWQVLGSDNHQALLGAPPCGVVLSEWSLADPQAWVSLRPILAENDGWALFLWTPHGRNHATRAFESRAMRPGWFTLKSPATATDVFSQEQLDIERAEMIAESGSVEEGAARYAAEYLVDFDVATPGAYYGSLLGEAELAGRIGRVPFDPALRVDTAWDLGIDDYTAVWFFQQVGREVRVVDYFETSGEGLPAVVAQAMAGRDLVWGAHHLPHDVMVREMNTGKSRYETLRTLGLNHIEVGVAADPEERVNAARLMIPTCWFDAERCRLGLERLRAYRKRWNRSTASFMGPLHDQASHGADAFGEFALNRRGALIRQARRERPMGQAMSWMA